MSQLLELCYKEKLYTEEKLKTSSVFVKETFKCQSSGVELKWTTERLLRSYFPGLSGALEELYLIYPISSVSFTQLSMDTFRNVLRLVFQVSC